MPRYTQGFESAREAKRHWDAHSDLLGLKTLDEYVERADTFLGAPLDELPGVEECQRPLGDWVRYNLRTQEFGTMSEDRVFIKTYFISERRYWRGRTFREWCHAQCHGRWEEEDE
jgi:hypothetical protein